MTQAVGLTVSLGTPRPPAASPSCDAVDRYRGRTLLAETSACWMDSGGRTHDGVWDVPWVVVCASRPLAMPHRDDCQATTTTCVGCALGRMPLMLCSACKLAMLDNKHVLTAGASLRGSEQSLLRCALMSYPFNLQLCPCRQPPHLQYLLLEPLQRIH